MTKALRSMVLSSIGLLVAAAALAAAQSAEAPVPHELLLQLDPARSGADITLTGNLHTVEGAFLLKRGAIHFDPATGRPAEKSCSTPPAARLATIRAIIKCTKM